MIATIVCGLIMIVCIVVIILDLTDIIYYANDEVASVVFIVSLFVLFTSLVYGYVSTDSKEERESEKNTIIFLLEQKPDKYSIELAEKYNEKEHLGNNYWCRFTLREEDTIDIYSYLIAYGKEESKS